MNNSSFSHKVHAMIRFRDSAHPYLYAQDRASVATRPFRAYAKWYAEHRDSDTFDSEEVAKVFPVFDKNLVQQVHRTSTGLKPFVGEGTSSDDKRVWDIFKSREWTGTQVQCGFFYVTQRSTSGDTVDSLWSTAPATEFERVIYLSMMQRLRRKPSTTTRRSKAARVSGVKLVKGFTNTRDCSQRVAYVIQVITNAWNALAKFLTFRDAEEMFKPYILFKWQEFKFEVIPEGEGFAPKSQEREIRTDFAATSDPSLTYPGVTTRPGVVDSKLRELGGYFLEDLEEVGVDDKLFDQGNKQWAASAEFATKDPNEGLPARFKDIKELYESLSRELGVATDSVDITGTEAAAPPATRAPGSPEDRVQGIRSGRSIMEDTQQVPTDGLVLPGMCGEGCSCEGNRKCMESLMEQFIRIYNCSFEDLVEEDDTVKPRRSPNISGGVQLILTDPPYGVRLESGRPFAEHDVMTEDTMQKVVEVAADLLRPGGHIILFCSTDQYPVWAKKFRDLEVEEEEEKAFQVDKQEMVFINSPGHYKWNGNRLMMGLQGVTEKAIHAVRTGIPKAQAIGMVRYENHDFVKTRFPAYTNVIDQIERISQGESLWYQKTRFQNQRRVRPEQKSILLLQELIARFSKPRDIVVDLFAGTFSTAIACCTIPGEELRTFVGSETDADCYHVSRWHVQNVFAKTLTKEYRNPDIFRTRPGSDVVECARQVLPCAAKHRAGGPTPEPWVQPDGMPQFQVLPFHIASYLSTEWQLGTRDGNTISTRPFHTWATVLRGRLHTVNLDDLLRVETTALGLEIRSSLINHPSAGEGVFATRKFSKGDLVCSFYGTLVYSDLTRRVATASLYGSGATAVSVEAFRRYSAMVQVGKGSELESFLPLDSYRDAKGEPSVYISPFKSCVGGKMNDPRYLKEDWDLAPGSTEENIVLRDGVRHGTANVKFLARHVATKPAHLADNSLLEMRATRDIEVDEELYVHYGQDVAMFQ